MEFDNNGKRKVYNVDLDGTLTNGEPFWTQEPTINPAMLEKVVELYKSGNIIIIWTARQWKHAPETVGWLIKNCVPYHGIQMGKGGADCYIDDKNVLIKDLLDETIECSKETVPGAKLGNLYSGQMPGLWMLDDATIAKRAFRGDTIDVGGKNLMVMDIFGSIVLLKDWSA
jgi:trehalose-6-phosphatase